MESKKVCASLNCGVLNIWRDVNYAPQFLARESISCIIDRVLNEEISNCIYDIVTNEQW
jgi:hypothetical protein